MKIEDRKTKAGSDTPEDDVYVLTSDYEMLWCDNAEDADNVEKEIASIALQETK